MKASLLHNGIVSYGKTIAITNVARNQLRQQGGRRCFPRRWASAYYGREGCRLADGGGTYIGRRADLYRSLS